uniref:Uncharacterized protein n=1 Tax=Anguilla anguilla TaxID=7936 RepID=A0A0E9RXX4_ANGAN
MDCAFRLVSPNDDGTERLVIERIKIVSCKKTIFPLSVSLKTSMV